MTDSSISDNVRVLLFASLQEHAGWRERAFPLPQGWEGSALDVWTRLDLGPWSSSWRVAINQTLVSPDHPVRSGDEVAFLPPFTGG